MSEGGERLIDMNDEQWEKVQEQLEALLICIAGNT